MDRKQFPLMLSYPSQKPKPFFFIDLSKNVFNPGMAYVALSRVCTLCLTFVRLVKLNRLRKTFDLPNMIFVLLN